MIHIHHHYHFDKFVLDTLKDTREELFTIKQNQFKIMEDLKEVLAQLKAANESINTVNTNVTTIDTHVEGIRGDVQTLKDKISTLEGGAAPDGSVTIAKADFDEIKSLAASLGTAADAAKEATTNIATATEGLDSENA